MWRCGGAHAETDDDRMYVREEGRCRTIEKKMVEAPRRKRSCTIHAEATRTPRRRRRRPRVTLRHLTSPRVTSSIVRDAHAASHAASSASASASASRCVSAAEEAPSSPLSEAARADPLVARPPAPACADRARFFPAATSTQLAARLRSCGTRRRRRQRHDDDGTTTRRGGDAQPRDGARTGETVGDAAMRGERTSPGDDELSAWCLLANNLFFSGGWCALLANDLLLFSSFLLRERAATSQTKRSLPNRRE